jgi:hypothetical protein
MTGMRLQLLDFDQADFPGESNVLPAFDDGCSDHQRRVQAIVRRGAMI